jgi:enamine deaminase RidA (YjgF/YER057c/UK114 family)
MWPPTIPSTELALSRRTVLRGAASAGLLPLASLLPAPAGADAHWITSEHPAFSVGATVGGLTFVAQDAGGRGSLPASTTAQAERTLDNLRLALASAEQSLGNVVFLLVMISDYREAPAAARLVQAAFPRPERAPATCFIGVSKLNPAGCLVRMDAIATTIADRAQIVVPGLPSSLARACMRSASATLSSPARLTPLTRRSMSRCRPAPSFLITSTPCCAAQASASRTRSDTGQASGTPRDNRDGGTSVRWLTRLEVVPPTR